MAKRVSDELLEEFCRPGVRTYSEARELLLASGFEERPTQRGHVLWVHQIRHSSLTITMKRDLKPCYKQLIKRKIQELQLED